jgi:hypothetical protein
MSNFIIQSILIPTAQYSVEDATDWIRTHGYTVTKIHTTKAYHRFRQHTPQYAKIRKCTNVRTIPIGNDGIKFIVNYCDEIEGGGIFDIGKSLIYGRSDYSPDQKRIIEKYGNSAIRHIRIGRTPLPSAINSVLNIVTFGAFQKLLQSSPYDKLFHLFSIIELDNGTKILLEKNAQINMKVVSAYNPKNTEYVDATYIPSGLTFKELLDNGQKIQGNKWFKYNGTTNNCQDYIISVLKGSSVLTKELQDFIKQDVKSIFQTLPITKQIMNTITGLGAVVDVVQKGGKN